MVLPRHLQNITLPHDAQTPEKEQH